MCISTNGDDTSEKPNKILSPWKRFVKQPLKPKLSREVVKSARVNLNRYWSKFEQLAATKMSLTSIISTDEFCINDNNNDNDINENIVNTLKQSGK